MPRRIPVLLIVAALLAALAGCASQQSKPEAVLMGPYVNATDNTEARVLWVTRADAPGAPEPWLELADDGRRIDSITRPITDRPETLYVATLDGLDPGMRYDYTLTDGKRAVDGHFTTAPATGADEPFSFVIYGDNRTRPERHKMVADRIASTGPHAFVVNTGDMVTNGTMWDQWKVEMLDPADRMLRRTILWPVRGNHEQDAVLMRDLFELPGNELYYSFDAGNVHVVVLDCYQYEDPYDAASVSEEMVRWLDADLAATDAEWVIATYHAPTFDVGGHASDWGRDSVLPVLEKHGVDLVVNGHSHIYERFRPIGPAGRKPIIHVVSGGGGAPNYPIRPSPILETTFSDMHFCRFQVEGNRLSMQAIHPDGTVMDRFELIKTDGRFQPEIMRKAITTEEAEELAFVASSRLWGDFLDVPEPGEPVPVNLSAIDTLPAGAVIRIGQADDSPWRVEPATFTLNAPSTGDDAEPMQISVRPPASLDVRPGVVDPPLKVSMAVRFQGRTWPRDSVTVSLSRDTIRKLTPEPSPMPVARAEGAIAVDGKLDDWAGVPPLMLPATDGPARTAKLAWRPEGLYISFDVPDDNVQPNPSQAWMADSVEVFIEADYARSFDGRENPAAMKIDLSPRTGADAGPAQVGISYGRLKENPDALETASRRTADGYTLEAFIPARILEPADMAEETVMGFNFILRDDGELLEQFVDTTGKSGVWRTPLYWGAVRLGGTAVE